jgi:hypothetical protein
MILFSFCLVLLDTSPLLVLAAWKLTFPEAVSKLIVTSDSRSLYNLTLSPGWTEEETTVLKLAVMKHSIGHWAAIEKAGTILWLV